MAEIMASALRDKFKEKYKQRNDIKFLNKELRSIRAAVSMMSDLPQDELDMQAKFQARRWRELSYDIEDVLDTLLALGKCDDPASYPDRSKGKGLVKKMTNPFFKNGRTGRHIAGEIRDLKTRIIEVAETHYRYKVDELAAGPAVVDPRLSALFVERDHLVGIDEARDELVRRLTEGDGASYLQLKIVSLVGLPGVGKTTLASQLYQKIKSTFECSAFVHLSSSPNMMHVFAAMFAQLQNEDYRRDIHEASSWDETKAIDKLKNFFQSKRYLIIVDDIWDTKSWRIIKQAMVENNLGSRIITTTRKLDVAEEIGGAYKVKPLSHESSRILLYRRVFSTNECPSNELAEMSDNILKKCGGVPLAIITIASVLAVRGMGHMMHQAMDIFSGPGFGQHRYMEIIGYVISLSYNDFPFHLKACLRHASLFPEDHLIRRDSLVWMWIAEGFIQEKQGYNLFEVGQSYVDELLNSSMIQEVDTKDDDGDDTIKYCCVPTMVLDFICFLSREENFVIRIDGSHEQSLDRAKLRRMSLQNGAVELPRVLETDGCLSQVRSVTAFGSGINLMPVLPSFHLLRVMDLEGTDLQGHNLKNLGKLLLLRYLGLRGTLIPDLPNKIGNLGMLQVLDLKRTRIKDLPSAVARLRRLLCLYVECTTKLPQGMGNLTSLEELSNISISEFPMLAEVVSSLVELRVLGIVLQQDDANESLQKRFLESLCNLNKLQTLRIFGRGVSDLEYFMSEGWMPPPALRMFVAVDCWFSAVPTWITSTNLTELQIGVRELLQEGLQILGRLQELRTLKLAVEHMMEELAVDADAFPRLRFLRLRCGTCLVFRRGAMPEIRTLEFVLNVDSAGGQFDWGLENLTSLEQISVTLRRGNGSEAEVLEAEAALKDAIRIHPNRPDLKITMDPLFPSHEEQGQEQEDAPEENSSSGPSEIRECSA